MKRRLLLTALTIVSALLGWAVWIAATTYMRAPRMVAELADTGALPFSPSELSRSRICALLVGDGDATFYTHHGVGLTDGHPGHTTITQAIGKRLFFKSFSPGLLHHRKIQLMIAAWAFDRRISKETQLKLFLNRAYGEISQTSIKCTHLRSFGLELRPGIGRFQMERAWNPGGSGCEAPISRLIRQLFRE